MSYKITPLEEELQILGLLETNKELTRYLRLVEVDASTTSPSKTTSKEKKPAFNLNRDFME